MQTPRENDGNVFTISTVIKAVLGLVALCLTCTAHAQTETWTNTGGSSWTSTNNWSNNTVPTAFGVAEFDADPTSTGSNSGVGPTFLTTGNTAVNNGTYTGAEGTLPDQAVGAISVTSSHTTTSLYFGSTGTQRRRLHDIQRRDGGWDRQYDHLRHGHHQLAHPKRGQRRTGHIWSGARQHEQHYTDRRGDVFGKRGKR